MSDKISDAQAKVEWADKHIEDFKETIVGFQDTYPYKFDAKRDPETRQPVYYMTEIVDVPQNAVLITGDVLQCLRTALDYLICAHSKKTTSLTAFPIFDPAKIGKTYLTGKIGEMLPAAQKIVTDLKPYKGGNETLWKLHELNRIDKHRLLFTACACPRGFDINQHRAYVRHGGPSLLQRNGQTFVLKVAQSIYIPPVRKVFPLKAGDVLFVDSPDAKINKNIDFRFDVAFNEPGICEGDPVLETLKDCFGLVREIVAAFAKLS